MARPSLVFWYEFSSPFSHLAAQRLPALAQSRGIDVVWRPFFLGAVFQAKGYATSPNLVDPVKAAYMMRDTARSAARSGLGYRLPETFPVRSILVSRAALQVQDTPAIGPFTAALFRAIFVDGRDVANPEVVADVARACGLDAAALLAGAQSEPVKEALRVQTQAAMDHGVFGAPSFVVGSELFWGNDRLEDALDWAVAPWM